MSVTACTEYFSPHIPFDDTTYNLDAVVEVYQVDTSFRESDLFSIAEESSRVTSTSDQSGKTDNSSFESVTRTEKVLYLE